MWVYIKQIREGVVRHVLHSNLRAEIRQYLISEIFSNGYYSI